MKLEWATVDLPLAQPFVTARGTKTTVQQIFVRVSDGDACGWGTAVLVREAGITAETVVAALKSFQPILAFAAPYDIESILQALEFCPPKQASAIASVDLALHDLLGRRARLPIRHLWGLGGMPVPSTALSLAAEDDDALLSRAESLNAWPILKLKMTPFTDPALVSRVRERYRGRIWVDGNGCWDIDRALRAADIFARADVELLEQPIPPGSVTALRALHERSAVPIVADEDCCGLADVFRLAGSVYAVNLKLFRIGGLLRTLEAIRVARRLGLKVMLGSKTESTLGVTAIAQLGGLADYLDLDGHLDIVGDPFAGVRVAGGRVTLGNTSGLGIRRRSALPIPLSATLLSGEKGTPE